MSLIINTNIASLNAQRNLSSSQSLLNRSMQRLSSGLRINSAKDDAAGLAISDRMTAQIRGLNQASRNAQDGISLAQTAEGAMQEITNMLQRMRELAVQSANDTNSPADRDALQAEFTQLSDEITRIADSTTFNGTQLLNNAVATTLNFQVGANDGATDKIAVTLSTSMIATTLGVGSVDGAVVGALDIGFDTLPATTTANIDAAIVAIDAAITTVDGARATFGAVQSRFESTIANVMNISENLSAARSRIMDADIAMETANLTKANILQQAGASVLAQANQMPMIALSLLG